MIADTTDGAADGNTFVEYTKTPVKTHSVGDLSANLVDDIPFDIGGGVTAITVQKQARLFVCRLLIAPLVVMQTMYMPK